MRVTRNEAMEMRRRVQDESISEVAEALGRHPSTVWAYTAEKGAYVNALRSN